MSLVEQAIARMRNQGRPPKPVIADGAARPSPAATSAEAVPEPVKSTRRMVLNLGALRAEGYLPEESKERQFTDHYRRIKRPLIDKALSGTVTVADPRVIMVTSALPGDG